MAPTSNFPLSDPPTEEKKDGVGLTHGLREINWSMCFWMERDVTTVRKEIKILLPQIGRRQNAPRWLLHLFADVK